MENTTLSNLLLEVNRLGYQVLEREQVNNIIIVLAQDKNEYVTWLYNIENNCLFSGYYFSHFQFDKQREISKFDAYDNFERRIQKEKRI